MQWDDCFEEEMDLESDLDFDFQDDLHDLSPVEELDIWDHISPYGKTTYDGTRFYD